LRTELAAARRQAAADTELGDRGIVAPLAEASSASQAEVLSTRVDIEDKRLRTMTSGMSARLAAQKAQVARLRAIAGFRARQIEALRVSAGAAGVLQELPLEAGQWVMPGGLLAKVAQPDRLKAQVRVPQTLIKDVAIGQRAEIDTQNGVVAGRVVRIDPAVQGGTVTVDVALDGELPKGARPDLSIVGVIELERLTDVLWVDRPAFAQPDSALGVYKLVDGGDAAQRVTVRLGRASVKTIEVLGGLAEGDRIILSDMSNWDAHERVRLE
jgi:multidrug resistance efflux pump